jgi:predicted transcriptional regulator
LSSARLSRTFTSKNLIRYRSSEKMAKNIANLSGDLAEDYLYEVINAHEGLSVYELAKLVGWSTGKVYHIVKALDGDGLVQTEKLEEGGRIKKKIYPVDWEKLLPEDVKRTLFADRKGAETDKEAHAKRRESILVTTA